MRYLLRFFVLTVLLAVGSYLYLNMTSGEFKAIEEVEQKACKVIKGVPGTEDIDLHRLSGLAFFSSDDRGAESQGRRRTGGIYGWDTTGEDPPRLLTANDPALRPHGISLVEVDGGGVLFVVDHRVEETSGKDGEPQHSIRVYDWDGIDLNFRESFTDQELVVDPNDVAGLSDGTFYVTNDHGSQGGLGRLMEDFLRIGGGSVVYYDGNTFRTVADGIPFANGVAVDEELNLVYVASTTTGRISVYDRDEKTGALDLREEIETGTGVDNIEIGLHGNLWVAAHPKLLTFTKHARNPTLRSPSELLWISREASADPRVRTLWRNLGEEISGSSVVVPVGARLMVGSVFEPHVLVCERAF